MAAYRFYVGSTDSWLGHWSMTIGSVANGALLHPRKLAGEWNGATEYTGEFTIELDSDAAAQRVAYAMAVITHNAAILVVRDLDSFERELSLKSVARYVVTMRHDILSGNRTFSNVPDEPRVYTVDYLSQREYGYAYAHDIKGEYVAWLVNSDATVSAI